MKLTFIGTGSAFTIGSNNYHSNMFLESSRGKRMLIDCGSDARFSLFEVGLSFDDLDDVYISHLHADHVGGLEWLGFTRKFASQKPKPILHISEKYAKKIWDRALSGTMKSLATEIASLDTYFEVRAIPKNAPFTWEHISFKLIEVFHVMNGRSHVPSYGLFFNVNGKNIYITTDCQFHPHRMMPDYLKADLIFHDCETSSTVSNVHTRYESLLTLPQEIRAKMWLYHYNPGPLPDAVTAGFKGFVQRGQTFQLDHVDCFK
jgi:ribonuclease BN (tRNA processing enzyme)